jgi:cell division control protein 6
VELTPEKIAQLRQKIQKQNSIFKEKRYLDSLFLPSKIIGREKQAEQLIQYINSLKQGLLVPVISAYGRSGTGKSTVVRFVCKNLSDIFCFSFVNLRKAKTVFGCAHLILSELGFANLKSAQGMNKAIDLMEKRIQAILEKENKKFFVLALDEYDVIFSDPRGRPSDFVFKLLTLEENLREKGFWLCIITISNNALADNDLDDRVKSRMGNSEIFFEPYGEDDVFNILRDRAQKAFVKKIDDFVLQHCAKLSTDDHGDARRALELLRVAGELSDGTKITKADIDNATDSIQKDRISTIISNAALHQRVVIAAICACSLLTEYAWNSTSSIYERYKKYVEENTKPLSYRRVVDLLVEIKNSGLVESRTLSKGRGGYGTEYKLKLSPEMVGPFVGKKWWDNLVLDKIKHEADLKHRKMFDGLSTSPGIKMLREQIDRRSEKRWREKMGLDL